MISSIEQSGERGIRPRIHLSELGLKQTNVLETKFEQAKSEASAIVVAIVRCWNKDEDAIKLFAEKMKVLKEKIPGLQGVLMSINQKEDAGVTEKSLKAISANTSELDLVPLQIENYSLTAGLNSGAALINELCLQKKINRDRVRILNLSFDVELTPNELEQISELINQDARYIFTVREDEADVSQPRNDIPANRFEALAKIIRNPESANLTELVPLSRNTLSIYKLMDVVDLGGFNPNCNGQKVESPTGEEVSIRGMEDHELWMRTILRALKENKISVIKDLKKSLDNPVTYNDADWSKMSDEQRAAKLKNEKEAIRQIFAGLASKALDGQVIPVEKQDFILTK